MPLQIKPHTITVRSMSQITGSNSVLGNPVTSLSGAPIQCLCVPLKPSESFHRFGVVLVDPWVIYLDVEDITGISPQAEIEFGSSTYYVKGDVEIHSNGDDTDCAVVFVARLGYPGAS